MRPRAEFDAAITRTVTARARTEAGAAVAAQLWRGFAEPGYDLRELAGRVTAPTLLVWGTQDAVLPLRAGRQTHRALPGSRLEVLDTGHVVFASDPDGFLTAVEPFLAAAFQRHAGMPTDHPADEPPRNVCR
jgi:pimeloyl-ACP methyl ester carboxylesterase